MRRTLLVILALGLVFGLGLGLHASLVRLSGADGPWAEHAATTCATCHGG